MLERTLDCLIFALVENLYQFLNRGLRVIEFFSSLRKAITLRREAVVLFEGLLVNVLVFLQSLVDFLEFRRNLILVSMH